MSHDEGRWAAATASYWSRSALKKRGWTTNLVRLHLGEPDKVVANPHDPVVGDPASLYRRDRVEAAENSDEFKADLAQRGRALGKK